MSADTLPRALAHAAEVAPPSDCFIFIDRRERETSHHFSDIYARARRAAGALYEAGVRSGDRVAIVLPTGQPFIDVLFGSQLLGAVPVPLYPPVRLGRLDEYYARTAAMLEAVEAVVLVTERRVTRLMGQVFARYRPRLGTVEAATLHQGPEREMADTSPDALAMVQFSSGTTIAPKPVGLTHRQVLANVDAILDFVPTDQDIKQVGCTWLPLYHDMGLIGCVYTATVGVGPLALIPPEIFLSKPALWLRAISRHKATASPAPNFAYSLCAQRVRDEEMEGCDLSSWRIAMNGAEPVAPRALRAFRERFSQWGLRPEALTPVYGLAEAALAVTFSDPSRPFETRCLDRAALAEGRAVPSDDGAEHASVGRPLRGFRVEIRDDDGAPLPSQRVGHIWASGPSIMAGYLDREEQPIRDGWLDTGDLGFMLDGELFIAGRAKDVIILRGQNHAPHDIEQSVDGVEGVRAGCAIAVGDVTEDGERLLLFVEYRDAPREGLAEDCRKAAVSATGLNPDLVLVVPPGTLPRTSSGKLRRAEALRQHRAGTLAPPESVTPWLIAGAMARSLLGYAQSRRKR
ncbi:MAG: fatty-acyl-CoA synthase [Myxococcota bacterium]|jgi:fatty-acyl-CoA synthase